MAASPASSKQGVEALASQLALTISDAGLATAVSGRIFALLMTSDEPLSQSDIKARLGVSEGSVSEGTRSLETMGMIERVSYPKVRRDFFQVHPQAWTNCAEHTLRFVADMANVGEQLLAGVARPKVVEQVRQMQEYYARLAKELPSLLRHQP